MDARQLTVMVASWKQNLPKLSRPTFRLTEGKQMLDLFSSRSPTPQGPNEETHRELLHIAMGILTMARFGKSTATFAKRLASNLLESSGLQLINMPRLDYFWLSTSDFKLSGPAEDLKKDGRCCARTWSSIKRVPYGQYLGCGHQELHDA
jgi:hypothetical protein